MGLPKKSLMFFLGILSLPPLAGIIHIFFKTKKCFENWLVYELYQPHAEFLHLLGLDI